MFNFDTTYSSLPEHLFTFTSPVKVTDPKFIITNKSLIKELGLADIPKEELLEYLSGNKIIDGSTPLAQAYAGHQFGNLAILGDGRAVLLGEHTTPSGEKVDIQLKGSGRTPYSRGGDGRGSLYSMLREFVISDAMEKLGVATTKSLAIIATGEDVHRNNGNRGGIVTRVASSHIRVGTFVYVALKSDTAQLKIFADYVINRHYPTIAKDDNPYLSLVTEVIHRQADLIVDWMRVGFIHGVMNTDNMAISGETIDYGPCAFMDTYDPKTVFSSIDHNGRYSFENQRNIGGWNIARFAESLVTLIDSDEDKAITKLNKAMTHYSDYFDEKYNIMMAAKIGISEASSTTIELSSELLTLMDEHHLDYTTTFRNLVSSNLEELSSWYPKWKELEIDTALMDRTNPAVIPRNHIVENALTNGADHDNLTPLIELLKAQKTPYSNSSPDYFVSPPQEVASAYRTYCGT